MLAWFQLSKESSFHYKPDLDLFIADKVFNDADIWESDCRFYESSRMLPNEIWNPEPKNLERNIQWVLPKEQFEQADSVIMGITNNSWSKIYYMSWGKPNSRLRDELIIFDTNGIDTIEFFGFGCGTGIYLAPLCSEESAISKEPNFLESLVVNRLNLYEDDLDSIEIKLEKTLGDSVKFRFRLASYRLPWNINESQMLISPYVTIDSKKFIKNLMIRYRRAGGFSYSEK